MIENWTEKYRPKTLCDIIGQDSIIRALQDRVNNGKNISHLIFHGRAGTGKTTTAKALARDTIGDNWQTAFMEQNASDDRGIDNIRKVVINYARYRPFINTVPFKILFLDEADGITPEALECLRVPMEKYAHNCRFILSCNNISKIIEPIISRCTVYEFKPISKENIVRRLHYISKRECLATDVQQLNAIAKLCKGDLRKAINNLQMSGTSNTTTEQTLNLLV